MFLVVEFVLSDALFVAHYLWACQGEEVADTIWKTKHGA